MTTGTQQTAHLQKRSRVPATILVVDNEREQRDLLCSILEKTGLNACGFKTASDALASMRETSAPALIITGMYMPGIDGWQLCRLLRSHEYPELNHIPILVVSTSAAGEEHKRIATALGVYAYLASPFDADAFVRQVLEILRGQATPVPLRALIVESAKPLAALLANAFAAEGYTADTALSIHEANEALERRAYDVAVIDYQLPDGCADALLDRCRSTRPECVCVIMTDPAPGQFTSLMGRGAAACVHKPCEPAYLLKLCDQTRKERALMRAEHRHATLTRDLRESRTIFRGLTEAGRDAIIMMDAAGAVTFWNPAAERMFGYEPGEITGRNLHEILASPESFGKFSNAFDGFKKTGTCGAVDKTLELRARCKEGRYIPVELSLSAVEFSDGWHAVAVIRDITVRKLTEEALRESEGNLSRILESVDAAVMSYSIKKDSFIYLSPSTEKLYGRTIEECIRNKFTVVDSVHPADIDILHDITTRMAHEGSAEGECRILRPDGSIVWVHVRVKLIRDAHGEPERIDRIITDITDRKNLELQLRKSQDELSGILNEIDDIVMSSRLNEKSYYYLSPSFTKLFGSSAEKHADNNHLWAESVHPDDSERLYGHVIELGEQGSSECELRIVKPDGTVAWVRVRSKIINDDNGRPERLQRILTDITAHKRAEQEREELHKRLLQAQKMESIARLAGGVAHDFNNMLSLIIGHADLALSRLTPGQSLHKIFSQIRRAAERSAALTRQLLAFAGRQAIAPRVLELNETIQDMRGSLEQLLGPGVRLLWQPGPDDTQVRMDPAQIDQILAELCQNGRDAIDGTGTVTIRTDVAAIDETDCALHPGLKPGSYVILTVSDNGRGMDAEKLATIFEPFTDAIIPGKGAGLGLATVYGIIRQNSGSISITSNPGAGTCITIYLPRYSGALHIANGQDELTQQADHRNSTILMVEDEIDNLELYRAMLESLKCTVLAAATPQECMQLVRTHDGEIDLMITDVVMPDTNGRELADKVLKMRPGTKCLFMSGYSADVIAQHGILDPDINFIEKPFSLQDFTAKVKELLDSKNNTAQRSNQPDGHTAEHAQILRLR